MGGLRRYVIDEVARWWTQAPDEARYALMQRVHIEAPKELTREELWLAVVASETAAGEVSVEDG
jgi:hypothetical protein